jgi:hypothetical protein
MGVFDIFSKREERRSGKKPDVYEYESIPKELRVQIVHVLSDIIGDQDAEMSGAYHAYKEIHDALAREYGVFQLGRDIHAKDRLFHFVLETASAKQVIDAIEVSLAVATKYHDRFRYTARARVTMNVAQAIDEINFRFLEHGFGYQYESGHIVRVDSQFVHAEVVKPALILLSDHRYAGAEEEFLKAHRHYRRGDYKECMVECLKAFESTMKAICKIQQWQIKDNDTAKTLIDILLTNNLIPGILQNQINNLKGLLESGVPTLRNKLGGHGQGAVPAYVSPHIAAYALHLTASNIVLLVTAAKP